MGLARVAAMKKDWGAAQQRYAKVAAGNTKQAAAALYWRDVSEYNQSHDHHILGKVASELAQRYPDSEWTVKASVWAA
jgi:hypothetical protein